MLMSFNEVLHFVKHITRSVLKKSSTESNENVLNLEQPCRYQTIMFTGITREILLYQD